MVAARQHLQEKEEALVEDFENFFLIIMWSCRNWMKKFLKFNSQNGKGFCVIPKNDRFFFVFKIISCGLKLEPLDKIVKQQSIKSTYGMEDRLQNSAAEGDVEALFSILAEDPCVLENIDKKPFVSTPLHRAVSEGHIHFAKEIVNLKPTFAWKRDHLGRSPIHLALERRHQELVTWLITIDGELVRVKAKGMVTPLHYAAEIDDDSNLADFLYVCPSSIKDLTVKCETAVHVALKNRSFRAFNVLFGWLRHFDKEKILNWEDENGDTALHIATSTNQHEAMKLFIGYIKVNKKNLEGSTALDIFYLQQDLLEAKVRKILLRAKAKRAAELHPSLASRLRACLTLASPCLADPKSTSLVDYFSGNLTRRERILKCLGFGGQSIEYVPFEVRNIILVVAVLIATSTYQAALSPPGGTWQDDSKQLSANITMSNTTTTNSIGDQGQSLHHAGKIILGPFLISFFVFNTMAFYLSLSTIIIVIVGLPFSKTLTGSANFLLFAYYTALNVTFDDISSLLLFFILCGALLAYSIPQRLFHNEEKLRRYSRGKLRRGDFE